MKKEEILAKSRKENENSLDEREQQVKMKNDSIAKTVGVVICAVIVFAENHFFSNPPIAAFAAFSIYFSMNATENLLGWKKLKNKTNLLFGILSLVAFITFFAGLFVLLVKEYK